jgi:hypothetical protein
MAPRPLTIPIAFTLVLLLGTGVSANAGGHRIPSAPRAGRRKSRARAEAELLFLSARRSARRACAAEVRVRLRSTA